MLFTLNPVYKYIIIALVVVIVLIGILFLINLLVRKRKDDTQLIDVSNIIDAVGKQNIKNIEQVQSRVRIQVYDLTTVNLETLKEVSNGIFVTGDKLVMTFKEKTEEIVKALRREI